MTGAEAAAAAGAASGAGALMRLAAWVSPGFPTGAFAFSHGLETAVAAGRVADAAALAGWIADALEHGAGRTDAILMAHAARAGAAGDGARLADLVALARALQPAAERLAETVTQGDAFAATAAAAWGARAVPPGTPHAVALGWAAGAAGVPAAALLPLALQAFAASLVFAGLRLLPLGQTEGARVLAGLADRIAALAAEAAEAPLEAIGSAAFRIDIDAMAHETLEPRLFRS